MPKGPTGVYKRTIRGHTYFVARLVYPRRSGLKPRDFSAKTKAEAIALRDAARAEYERNPNADRMTTFGDFLEYEFIPFEESRYEVGEIGWERFKQRRSRLKRFILEDPNGERLRLATLAQLTPEMLERFYDGLIRRRLTSTQRNKIRQDLLLAFKKARRRLTVSVSEFFEDIPVAAETPKPKQLYDAEDIQKRLIDEQRPLYARAIVGFLMILCCRPNEMFPLEWSDINWKHNQVHIWKTLRKDRGGFKIAPFTKTGRKGDRVLPLGPLLSDLLRRLQKERMTTGKVGSPYVFCWDDGTMLDTYRFKHLWHRTQKDLGLPEGPKAYWLKTLGVSYKSANGVPDAVLAKLCGHTTTRMVQNTYRSVYDAELLKAVEVGDGNGLSRTG